MQHCCFGKTTRTQVDGRNLLNEKSIESQEQEVAEYYFVGCQLQKSKLALQKESIQILSYQQLYQLLDCFGQINMTSFTFWKVLVGHEILAIARHFMSLVYFF